MHKETTLQELKEHRRRMVYRLPEEKRKRWLITAGRHTLRNSTTYTCQQYTKAKTTAITYKVSSVVLA